MGINTLSWGGNSAKIVFVLFWKRVFSEKEAHYKNTPIQINRQFHLQKLKNFQIKKKKQNKKTLFFFFVFFYVFIFLLKT